VAGPLMLTHHWKCDVLYALTDERPRMLPRATVAHSRYGQGNCCEKYVVKIVHAPTEAQTSLSVAAARWYVERLCDGARFTDTRAREGNTCLPCEGLPRSLAVEPDCTGTKLYGERNLSMP
jgi:hypothetical protein